MIADFSVRIGPRGFRIGSDWRAPIAALRDLYTHYPAPADQIPDFTVRLEATGLLRRFIRPSVMIAGDYTLPEAAPLPLAQGLLAAEMAMNLQLALGERHFLLLHAATVERGGTALILTGESGSGKSTLAAALMTQGWRLLGDEFALIDPASGDAFPFPRPVSLKNKSVQTIATLAPFAQFGPWLRDTPKGDIRHLVPDAKSLGAMDVPVRPVTIVFPAFGRAEAVREVGQGEVFVRLTQASTNYAALGEAGFRTLTRLVNDVPALAIDYPDTATAMRQIDLLHKAAH